MTREQHNESFCTIPPQGWYCTRTPGHDGPCAAEPIEESYERELSEAEEAMIDAAWEKHKAAGFLIIDRAEAREAIAAQINLGERYATADRIIAALSPLGGDGRHG